MNVWKVNNFDRVKENSFMTRVQKSRIRDIRGVYSYAKNRGLAVKEVLRGWVTANQPEEFCNGMTSKEMCYYASLGLEGKPFVYKRNPDIAKTKFGPLLYEFMWDGKCSKDLEVFFIINQYG